MSANSNVLVGACMSLGPAGAAAGGAGISVANAFNYAVNGRIHAMAAGSVTLPAENGDGGELWPMRNGQRCVFVFGADEDQNVGIFQGSIMDIRSHGADESLVGQYPSLPPTHAPFAAVVVSADETFAGMWFIGVNDFTAAGITAEFEDLATLPDMPHVTEV